MQFIIVADTSVGNFKKGLEFYKCNGTARFKKCKQLFEYQHLLLLRDILVVKVLIYI